MVSGAVVGTISTAIWLPFLSSRPLRVCVSPAISAALSVPVWSTTRPVSGGTATSAQAATAQHSNSARMEALAAFIVAQPVQRFRRSPALAAPLMRARPSNYFAGAAGGGLKSTFGAVEISFSFSTEKFAFSLYPNAIAVRLVGNERMVTL